MSDDIRILTYDEDDLVDIEEEIDLSDIFDVDETSDGISDDEILGLFGQGGTLVYSEDDMSGKTMVVDRADIKEQEAAEQEAFSPEKQKEDLREELADDLEDIDRKKRTHRHSHIIIKLAFLLLGVVALAAIAFSPLFTIKNIKVEGNRFYTEEQIINMSEAKAEGNLFLNAQKGLIKKNLKDNVYFRRVDVRRSIPNTLVIEVEEKEELAALVYGDKYIVIDDNSEVLRVAKIDPEVTVLTGLTIKKMDVGQTLEVEEKKVFKDTLATLYAMRDGDFYFKRIEASGTRVKAYMYDMMKAEGTSGQLRESIEKGTLQKVVNKLMKKGIKRGTIILGDNNYISFSPAV